MDRAAGGSVRNILIAAAAHPSRYAHPAMMIMNLCTVLILSAATATTAPARDSMSLADQVRQTPLIIVAHVSKVRGYIGEGVWEVELAPTAILKGSAPKPLGVFWTRTGIRRRTSEIPAAPTPQELKSERIWFLKHHVEANMMTAYDFQHPLRSVSERTKIEAVIKKQAAETRE